MNKTNRILFLCRRDDRIEYDTAWSMAGGMTGQASGFVYEAANIEDLVFLYDGLTLRIWDAASGNDLQEYSGIFLLGWFKTKALEDAALAVAKYADAYHIPLLNSEALYTRSRSKLSQYVIAALHGISVTPFVYSIGHQHMASFFDRSNMAFPVIVKSTMASRGRDNHLVHDYHELSKILTEQPEVPFVIQTFVPNDGDYRLVVMGDQVRLALHRQAQTDSHINNTSQGGMATIDDLGSLDQKMLAEAVKVAHLLRREVTGVDMIVHRESGQYYMLEANNMPQLSTGKHVEAKMAALDHFLAEVFNQGNQARLANLAKRPETVAV